MVPTTIATPAQQRMEKSVAGLARMVGEGELAASALVESALQKAEAKAALNAFITIDGDGARSKAGRVDDVISAGGDPGPLAGVPIVVKDNINVAGLRTTAGTPGIDFVAKASAPVVARLEAAQAIVIGKTNMHELAFGVTSNNAAFGTVRNAVDPTRNRAARPAEPRPRLRRASCPPGWGRIQAVRSGFPPRCAGSSAFVRPRRVSISRA